MRPAPTQRQRRSSGPAPVHSAPPGLCNALGLTDPVTLVCEHVSLHVHTNTTHSSSWTFPAVSQRNKAGCRQMLLDAGTPAALSFPDSFPPLSTLFSCSPALSLQRKTTDVIEKCPQIPSCSVASVLFWLNLFFCRGIPGQSHSRSYFSSFLSFCDGGMSLQWNAASLASGVTEDGQSEASRGTRRGEEGEEKMEGPCVGIPSAWLIPPNRRLKESCKQLHGIMAAGETHLDTHHAHLATISSYATCVRAE